MEHLELNSAVCRLFEERSVRKLEKLKAIMHYFQVVTDDSEFVPNPPNATEDLVL